MQIGNTPTLLIMQCADVHILAPSLPSLHSALSISSTHASLPISPWLTSKRTPVPLKVPFSLVLMADRLWPHSLSAAACPHCVPLSAKQRVGGGQTGSPKWMPDMDVWTGAVSSRRAKLSSTCNSLLPYASFLARRESERETHGLRVLVALGCMFNSWGS